MNVVVPSVQKLTSLELEPEKLNRKELRVDNIIVGECKLKFFTGFTNLTLFKICLGFITDYQLYENDRAGFSLPQQFLVGSMWLRSGMTEQHLAQLYGVSLTTISIIFSKWIPAMYRRF